MNEPALKGKKHKRWGWGKESGKGLETLFRRRKLRADPRSQEGGGGC